jgi:hypothetical protein
MFSQLWFVKHGFLKEEEFLPESNFTQEAVAVITKEFEFLAYEDRLQFNCTGDDTAVNAVKDSLIPILGRLSEIPFSACGFNFMWLVYDTEQSIHFGNGKALFCKEEKDLFAHFKEDDAEFGSYLTKDYNGARLRMEIKPVHFRQRQEDLARRGLKCELNFHFNLESENSHERLLSAIENFAEFESYSQVLINSIH